MNILKETEQLSRKHDRKKHVIIVATLNNKGRIDSSAIFNNLNPITFVGVHSLLSEQYKSVRDIVAYAPPKESNMPPIDPLTEKIYTILDEEMDGLRAGVISGDINDVIVNIVEKLKKANTK